VPEGAEDEDVPEAIVKLIKEKWGVDVDDDRNYGYLH
jgi:biotin operon repressor